MDLLDSRQLRAFQELALRGSFTEAANHLHLTQSAVSHSIKALEVHLDTKLFERQGKQVRLTNSGEVLLPHANRILTRMEKAQDELLNQKRPGHGRLQIGATVTISQYILPSILRELRESFPNFEITVATEDSRNLIRMIEQGDIDIAVALEATHSSRIEFEPLFSDKIEMAVSPMHPIAVAEDITMETIRGEDFIFYNKSSETFQLIEKAFSQSKDRIQASLQVGSMAAIKQMAQIGMGIGLLAPWVALDEISSGALVFRDLPMGNVDRWWGLYSRSDRENIAEDVFSGICQSVIQAMMIRVDKVLSQSQQSPAAHLA